MLLYHLVSNAFPVNARSVAELRVAHARGDAARLQDLRPDLPEAFVRIVERAIDRDPARRFASAGEMKAALANTHGATENGRGTPRPSRTSGRTKTTGVTPAPAFPRPGEMLGRYQMLEQIGAGGAGVVYRASDKRLKREVAVKYLSSRSGLIRAPGQRHEEAQVIAALSDPNILTLHDVGTERVC